MDDSKKFKTKQHPSGQATFEYIFILMFTTLSLIAMLKVMLPVVDNAILSFGAGFERNIKTGRAPAGAVWKN